MDEFGRDKSAKTATSRDRQSTNSDRDRYYRERHEDRRDRRTSRDRRRSRSPRRHQRRQRSQSPADSKEPAVNRQLSGLLYQQHDKPSNESSSKDGAPAVVVKYHGHPQQALPSTKWRLYVFKPKIQDSIDSIKLYGTAGRNLSEWEGEGRLSWFLFGRDRSLADIPTDHESCSKQHAVLQFKRYTGKNKTGSTSNGNVDDGPANIVLPYLIDLEAANGTRLNGNRIDSRRYYELRHKDSIRFGESTREYLLINEDLKP